MPAPSSSAAPENHTPRFVVLGILMRLTVDSTMRMLYPYLPEISRGLGITLSQGGLLLSIRSAMVFPSPFFGAWGDRHGPRYLLVGALLAQALGLWWLSRVHGLVAAIPAMILLGLASSAFIPMLQTAISEHVPFHRRGRVLGIVEVSWALTGLIILPLVGILMVARGWQAPLRLLAVLSLAVAPLPLLLPGRRGASPWQNSMRHLSGLVWRTHSARAAILVTGLIFVAIESFFVTYGAWLERSFGLAPDQIGRVAALLGVAELVASGSSSLFIDRIGKRRGVGAGLVAMTITMAALPWLGGSQALAVAGMFLATISFEFTIVSNIGLLSEQVPQARGTVLALGAMASGVSRTFTDYVGVALFERYGMPATAAYAVLGSAAAAFILFRWVQERAVDEHLAVSP